MLIKLLKYELKSNGKIQLVLVLVTICMIPVLLIANMIGNTILTSAITVFAFLSCIGAFIGYSGLQILCFAGTMSGKESYFTHTIPATAHQILLSKLISAMLWGIAVIASICLCVFVYYKTFGIVVSGADLALIKPIAAMGISQFIFIMNLIAFSVGITVHPRFTGQPKLIISVIAYFVLNNVCGILMLIIMGLQLYFAGELSSFLANEWSDARAIDFVYQIFYYVSVIYVLLAGLFYTFTAGLFGRHKSI